MVPFDSKRTDRKHDDKACWSQKKITQKGLKFARLKRPFLGKNSTFIKNNLNVLTSILINLIESIDKYILYSFVCFDWKKNVFFFEKKLCYCSQLWNDQHRRTTRLIIEMKSWNWKETETMSRHVSQKLDLECHK